MYCRVVQDLFLHKRTMAMVTLLPFKVTRDGAMAYFYRLIIFAVVLAMYMNWPPPPLSPALFNWKAGGKYFEYMSHRIFYRDEAGSARESTLVCLHGFPTSSYDWVKILPELKTRFKRIILLDFIGFGFSDKPTDNYYSLHQQANIVEMLLESLTIDSAHLLAHDYGDTVAEELLHRFNEETAETANKLRIESLLMLNGGMFPETNFPTPIQNLLVMPVLGHFISRLTCFQLFVYNFGSVFGPDTKPTPQEMKEFWLINTVNEGHKVTDKLLGYMAERWQYRDRWVGALQNTSVHIHTIYGPADIVNPPVTFIPFYRKTVPAGGLTVLTKNIGHYPQWESPSAVIENYFIFLENLDRHSNTSNLGP